MKPDLKMGSNDVEQGFALSLVLVLFHNIGVIMNGCIEGMVIKYVEREVMLSFAPN